MTIPAVSKREMCIQPGDGPAIPARSPESTVHRRRREISCVDTVHLYHHRVPLGEGASGGVLTGGAGCGVLRRGSHHAPGGFGSPSAPTMWGCLQWLDAGRTNAAKAAGRTPSSPRKYGPEGPKSPRVERREATRWAAGLASLLHSAPIADELASPASLLWRDPTNRAFRRSAPSHFAGGAGESTPA